MKDNAAPRTVRVIRRRPPPRYASGHGPVPISTLMADLIPYFLRLLKVTQPLTERKTASLDNADILAYLMLLSHMNDMHLRHQKHVSDDEGSEDKS